MNADLTAVGMPALGSANAAPTPLNLETSCTVSQSCRVSEYASMRAITSGMPSFSFPPAAADLSGRVMSDLSKGTYSPRNDAASALNSPPATQCECSSVSSRLFLPCVLFFPSHPGKRLKLRSPGNDPKTSLFPRNTLVGMTLEMTLAYGMRPQFCFARTLRFMTSPSLMHAAALATSCSRCSSFAAAYGR